MEPEEYWSILGPVGYLGVDSTKAEVGQSLGKSRCKEVKFREQSKKVPSSAKLS